MAKWIDKLLGLDQIKERQTAQIDMLSSGTPTFAPFNGNAYENDIYRAAVDSIARNAARLKGQHIVYSKMSNQRSQGDQALNRLLQTRPNPYMTAYDLIYKMVTHYYIHNNAFAYLQKDDSGNLIGIYPLSANHIEYVTDPTGEMYIKFLFANGKQLILHFSEVFVARRHFNSNDLLGDNNNAILTALELAHAQNEGLDASIKNNATIRGVLKNTGVLSPAKLKEAKEDFTKDFLSMSNHGGVAVLDQKFDYTPLSGGNSNSSSNNAINDTQIESIKRKIYDYLGISENIVNSTYSENEWAAFYESVIEPLALQFSLELTDKLFTEREQAFGNKILFESNRLQFASNESKTSLLKELVPMGLLTKNQALEILNLPPVEDGNKYLQSLNYVDEEIANEYQMKNKTKEGADGNERDQTHRTKNNAAGE